MTICLNFLHEISVFQKRLPALFCDLAREALSILSIIILQRFSVSWAQSSCSFSDYLALTTSSTESKTQCLSVKFLTLKTANSSLLRNRHTSSYFWLLSQRIKTRFIHFVKLPINTLLLAFNLLILSTGSLKRFLISVH